MNELTDAELVQRYQAGDESAAATRFRRYVARLQAVARSRCGRSFASRFDPDDVVQAAFRAWFARIRNSAMVKNCDYLGLLLVLSLNKIRTLVEHHSAAKRSVRRTNSSDSLERPPAIRDWRAETTDAIDFREQVDTLPEAERRVIRMRLEGFEVDEIATATGRLRRTIERVLHDFRERITLTN